MGLKCNNKKASYDDKYDADNKIKDIFRNGDVKDKTPTRYYKCICGKWHITSMPKEEVDKYILETNKRVQERQEKFIKNESEYYIKKYNLNK